jgi:hypothetical protein
MGVYADPSGVELKFYDKEGKTEVRPSVKSKGLLHSLHRADRRGEPEPVDLDYSLGSTDWLTDVMVAETEDELNAMPKSSNGACLTSVCSRMVRVQWKKKLPNGQIDSGRLDNCVTLAMVTPGTEDSGQRMPTKEIYVFPEGTQFGPEHPFWPQWHGTIAYLESIRTEVKTGA